MEHAPIWVVLVTIAVFAFGAMLHRHDRGSRLVDLLMIATTIAAAAVAVASAPEMAWRAVAIVALVLAWGAAVLAFGAALEAAPSALRRLRAGVRSRSLSGSSRRGERRSNAQRSSPHPHDGTPSHV